MKTFYLQAALLILLTIIVEANEVIRREATPNISSATIESIDKDRSVITLKSTSDLFYFDTKPVVVLAHPIFSKITIVSGKDLITLKMKIPVRGFTNVRMDLPLFHNNLQVGSLSAVKKQPLTYTMKIDSNLLSDSSYITLGQVTQIKSKMQNKAQ